MTTTTAHGESTVNDSALISDADRLVMWGVELRAAVGMGDANHAAYLAHAIAIIANRISATTNMTAVVRRACWCDETATAYVHGTADSRGYLACDAHRYASDVSSRGTTVPSTVDVAVTDVPVLYVTAWVDGPEYGDGAEGGGRFVTTAVSLPVGLPDGVAYGMAIGATDRECTDGTVIDAVLVAPHWGPGGRADVCVDGQAYRITTTEGVAP